MTREAIMEQLREMGNEGTKKILMRHGAREPFDGVRVGDLKKLVKKIKKNHELSLELYDTGNSDAMYLAGLIADETKITKAQLRNWAKKAYWYMLSDFTVAWVASETPFAVELAEEWMASGEEFVASAGWATLANHVSITPDEELDLPALESLLQKVGNEIHDAPNRVRYAMNGFIISVGSYVTSLTEKALATAKKVGKVSVSMGKTSCKVPFASDYIQKVADKGRLGKKRKQARC